MSEKETTLLQRYTTAKRFGSYIPILKKDITVINNRIRFLEQEESRLYKIKPSIPIWDTSTEEKRINKEWMNINIRLSKLWFERVNLKSLVTASHMWLSILKKKEPTHSLLHTSGCNSSMHFLCYLSKRYPIVTL